MIVRARPMMKPFSTGSEMNAARKPRRSAPAAMAATPVASASPAVSATNSAALGLAPATSATTPIESAAVADIGPTTRCRLDPTRA